MPVVLFYPNMIFHFFLHNIFSFQYHVSHCTFVPNYPMAMKEKWTHKTSNSCFYTKKMTHSTILKGDTRNPHWSSSTFSEVWIKFAVFDIGNWKQSHFQTRVKHQSGAPTRGPWKAVNRTRYPTKWHALIKQTFDKPAALFHSKVREASNIFHLQNLSC